MLKLHKIKIVYIYIYIILYFKYITMLVIDLQKGECWNYTEITSLDKNGGDTHDLRRTRWWRKLAGKQKKIGQWPGRITVWPTSGSRQKVPKTARADFNGAFLRLCQPPPPRPPKFLLPLPAPPWTRRVNGAHSLLRSFISPPSCSSFRSSIIYPFGASQAIVVA